MACRRPSGEFAELVIVPLSDDAKRALEQAEALAALHGSALVRSALYFLALATLRPPVRNSSLGANFDHLSDIVAT